MDGDAPLLSVIIATYNWSSVLRYALLSAQSQTFTDFEVLVIGDGCTDDSAEVVASLDDSRFRWENLATNHGHQSAANNRGLELARGTWIAYLGHDDLWMPNHLDVLLRELETKDGDVAYSLLMLVGAQDCGGRRLAGCFDNGQFPRGAHLPPSGVVHRKALVDRCGGWLDYRVTKGSPESDLFVRFLDGGAKFVNVAELTVFKFPSSWRPGSYAKRNCNEQADFFTRMHEQPDFLVRELIELGIAQELLKPHTRVLREPAAAHVLPGALIEHCRQNRGLTRDAPKEGPATYIPSPAMARLIDEEIRRSHANRFAVFQIFYARDGHYDSSLQTSTVVPIEKWTRVRMPLEHPSDGGPLRIDPCDCPAIIEIASIALRRGRAIEWRAPGSALDNVSLGGDAVRVGVGRTLKIRSVGNDPMLFLPPEAPVASPLVLVCWIRISYDE